MNRSIEPTRDKPKPAYAEELDPFEIAKQRGLNVVVPPANVLMLDIDRVAPDSAVWRNTVNLEVLGLLIARAGTFGLPENEADLPILQTTSQHGGTHVYIKLGVELSEDLRVALQGALGDDPRHVFYGVMRLLKDIEPVFVAFETDREYERVKAFLDK